MLDLKKAQDDEVTTIREHGYYSEYRIAPYSINGDPPIIFQLHRSHNGGYDRDLCVHVSSDELDCYEFCRVARGKEETVDILMSTDEFKHFETLADYKDDEYRRDAFDYLSELYEKNLPILIIDIVNTGGKVEKLRVNRRVAETYVKIEHLLANEPPALTDIIKAVQDLVDNGRNGASAPSTEQQLYSLMMDCIDNGYYGNWQALQDVNLKLDESKHDVS